MEQARLTSESRPSTRISPITHLSGTADPSNSSPSCLRTKPASSHIRLEKYSTHRGMRTLAAVGANEPAISPRLLRLRLHSTPVRGLAERRLDAVGELLEGHELGAHLDVAPRRAEVRAQHALRAELRDLEGVVLVRAPG